MRGTAFNLRKTQKASRGPLWSSRRPARAAPGVHREAQGAPDRSGPLKSSSRLHSAHPASPERQRESTLHKRICSAPVRQSGFRGPARRAAAAKHQDPAIRIWGDPLASLTCYLIRRPSSLICDLTWGGYAPRTEAKRDFKNWAGLRPDPSS